MITEFSFISKLFHSLRIPYITHIYAVWLACQSLNWVNYYLKAKEMN